MRESHPDDCPRCKRETSHVFRGIYPVTFENVHLCTDDDGWHCTVCDHRSRFPPNIVTETAIQEAKRRSIQELLDLIGEDDTL